MHKLAVNYNNVTKGERDLYEKDTIQGQMETTTFIENLVDKKLNDLDLAHFTLVEMKEVKSFFDGSRDKKLAELKKKKEKEEKKSEKKSEKRKKKRRKNHKRIRKKKYLEKSMRCLICLKQKKN